MGARYYEKYYGEYFEEIESLLENDEISAEEEGFMLGENMNQYYDKGDENE